MHEARKRRRHQKNVICQACIFCVVQRQREQRVMLGHLTQTQRRHVSLVLFDYTPRHYCAFDTPIRCALPEYVVRMKCASSFNLQKPAEKRKQVWMCKVSHTHSSQCSAIPSTFHFTVTYSLNRWNIRLSSTVSVLCFSSPFLFPSLSLNLCEKSSFVFRLPNRIKFTRAYPHTIHQMSRREFFVCRGRLSGWQFGWLDHREVRS